MQFAKNQLEWPIEKWRNTLWTDECKIVLFGGKCTQSYVRRRPIPEYCKKFTTKTVKNAGASIMALRCFSYYGVRPIHYINAIMYATKYVKILEVVMLPYASENMPLICEIMTQSIPAEKLKSSFRTIMS